jgi:hypothetical protein
LIRQRRKSRVAKSTKRPLNRNIVEQWPEIFEDIVLSAIPLPYLHSVLVTFKDGRHWTVVLKDSDRKSINGEIPKNLYEFFQNQDENIENIDFRIDVEKIKKDVIKNTNKLLKRKK